MLERCFGLSRSGATVGGEVRGGLTTFMVMAYIIFVNPAILSFTGIPALQGQGPPFAATQAATCLVAGLMTIAMGLAANYPLALASGMGLNAAVAFQLVAGMKLPWQAAMGVIVLEGVAITVFVLTGFREAIMNAIPVALKRAIGVGIGLFILFIGFNAAGIVKTGPPGVPLTLGDLTSAPVAVSLFGLLLMLWFQTRSSLGAGLDFSVFARVGALTAIVTIFSIMLSDFFDTMGTVIGVGAEAGWLTPEGRLPRLNRVLLVDSLAAVAGGAAGASSATTYVESAAGVAAGARTGLASVVTGGCFLLALFFAPVAGVVPAQATAPALILVGFLMTSLVRDIPFGDLEEGFPALLTVTLMPFTYSITDGIGAGFVTYCAIKLLRGKRREVHGMMYGTAAAFVIYFALPIIRSLLPV